MNEVIYQIAITAVFYLVIAIWVYRGARETNETIERSTAIIFALTWPGHVLWMLAMRMGAELARGGWLDDKSCRYRGPMSPAQSEVDRSSDRKFYAIGATFIVGRNADKDKTETVMEGRVLACFTDGPTARRALNAYRGCIRDAQSIDMYHVPLYETFDDFAAANPEAVRRQEQHQRKTGLRQLALAKLTDEEREALDITPPPTQEKDK